ncbi:MAG: hypothetical protein LBI01_05070 [Elusimicrobium sp.]|jgi:hypothetical protein|nr:hypothetical protein [Elusimicrobium sp.]
MERLNIFEIIKTAPYVYIAAGLVILILLLLLRPRKRKAAITAKPAQVSMQPKPLPGQNFARMIIEYPPLERMSVYSVNNDTPFFFTENGKTGFYLPAGNVEIKAEYFWPRRGVMYSTETVSSGTKKVLVTPAEGRTYYLSFNTDKESFIVN